MIGACRTPSTWASGTVLAACPPFGIHWMAPPGLRVCSHSKANRFVRYIIVHCVGAAVQAPSRPLVTVSSALPLPHLLRQPRPCASMAAAVGSGPTQSDGLCAPWTFPKVWPPAIRATVSSSFMAMRPKLSRICTAAASGSGLPPGPSGFT
jgi:hypothetical protein